MSWGCIARYGIRAIGQNAWTIRHRAIAATKPAAIPPSRMWPIGTGWKARSGMPQSIAVGPNCRARSSRRGSASKLPDRLYEL